MATLQGKVAIVTGASAGIGLATAKALAANGASVVLTGTRAANVEPAAAALRAGGARALAMALDLADQHSIAMLFSQVTAEFGQLDTSRTCRQRCGIAYFWSTCAARCSAAVPRSR